MITREKVIIALIIFLTITPAAFSQVPPDNGSTGKIKVHFLYGSKPGKQYKASERKWFGGKLGGHVGIEMDDDKVLNFVKQGKVHWFSRKNEKRSRYVIHSTQQF